MLTSALMRLTEAFTFVPVILSSTPFLLYPNENIIFVAKVIYSQHLELKQYGKLKDKWQTRRKSVQLITNIRL